MDIKIKYHVDNMPELMPMGDLRKSNWIDLRAAEDTFIPQGESAMISLGVSMQLPEGYEAHLAPRSSTFKNYGLICTNSFGIIDTSYCGDGDIWRFPVYCLVGKGNKDGRVGTLVKKNDRICQFRIMEVQPSIDFKKVTFLGNPNRGGIGSTGIK